MKFRDSRERGRNSASKRTDAARVQYYTASTDQRESARRRQKPEKELLTLALPGLTSVMSDEVQGPLCAGAYDVIFSGVVASAVCVFDCRVCELGPRVMRPARVLLPSELVFLLNDCLGCTDMTIQTAEQS